MAFGMKKSDRKSGAAVLEDWREDPALVAAQTRRKEIASLLATIEGDDLPRAVAAVDEEDRLLANLEVQVLSGREPESRLAAQQSAVLEAKRARALIVVRYQDLRDEDAKLEAAIPDLEFTAKDTAVRTLRKAYRQQLLALREALARVPDIQREMARLCQIGENSLPHDIHGNYDHNHPVRAGLVPVSVTKRSIQPGYNGYYMGSTAVSPEKAANDFLRETDEALAQMDALDKQRGY